MPIGSSGPGSCCAPIKSEEKESSKGVIFLKEFLKAYTISS